MAIVLEANYAKKLGLPGYSSHQYSVSIRTELTDLTQVPQESDRLYRLLQDAVDDAIQQPGYLPGDSAPTSHGVNGASPSQTPPTHANGRAPSRTRSAAAGPNGSAQAAAPNGSWRCSDKQRDLIEKLVRERQLDKSEVEALARERFGSGVRQLDRLQASGLIDELIERQSLDSQGAPAARGTPRRKLNGNGRATAS